jgi:DNA-binding CsgD family transcriptional regulator/tetratricopeptide (TPR) repeat protein
MSQRLSSGVLAGRATELGELVAAMDRAIDGTPSVVLIGGEAGIGKSRLVAELAARADDATRVMWGQCAALDDAVIPLLPVAEALTGAGDGDAPHVLATGPATAQLVAAPAARMHAAVLDRLGVASTDAPVLLVLEDIHWADRSTLDLLAFLARRLRTEQILIVATYRDDEVDRRDGLRRFLAEIATAPSARRIELAGLERAALSEQIAGILGSAPSSDLVDDVLARSGGNPFFAEELVAARESGSPDGLSGTLRDVLLARITALDAMAQAVVRVAAAGGREVDHRLLAIAAGLAEPALSDALRAAVRHHVLLAHERGFAFRHALLQEVAYGELLPGERAQLHAALAAALEANPDLAGGNAATVAAEIAHHWLRAGDEPRALAAAVRAGSEAERVGALAEAAGHDARALALWDVVPDAELIAGVDRATLLTRAADANAWIGQPADAVELIDAAIALVDPAVEPLRVAELHHRRGIYLWQLARPLEGVKDLECAVALIPAAPPSADRARALGRLGVLYLLSGQHAPALEHGQQALAVAREVGARAEEADALACTGQCLVALGDRPGGLEQLRRARSIAAEIGEEELLSHVAVALSDSLWRDGQLEEAVEVALHGADVSRRAGIDVRERYCELNAAEAAHELGRWDLVERISSELLALDLSAITLAFAHHVAGALARVRGDLDGAAAHLAAQRDALGVDETTADNYVLEDEAELALWQGRPDAAAREACQGMRREGEDVLRLLLMATLGVRAQADLAELARARRDGPGEAAARDKARALLRDARARARAANHPALEATIAAEHARAEGKSEPSLWDSAARAWEERRTPSPAAHARWRQGEAALARRDRVQGADALRAAHATAVSLGAAGLRSEIEALARRARIELSAVESVAVEAQPATPAAATEFGLTPRELEVLEHLALGQTNRQIADELFISIKTAGVHVSHILSKLGAANRSEAGAIAHRLGLVR